MYIHSILISKSFFFAWKKQPEIKVTVSDH